MSVRGASLHVHSYTPRGQFVYEELRFKSNSINSFKNFISEVCIHALAVDANILNMFPHVATPTSYAKFRNLLIERRPRFKLN
jgi:hypothetical protein